MLTNLFWPFILVLFFFFDINIHTYTLFDPLAFARRIKKSLFWNKLVTTRSGLELQSKMHANPGSACGLTLPPSFNTIAHSPDNKNMLISVQGCPWPKVTLETTYILNHCSVIKNSNKTCFRCQDIDPVWFLTLSYWAPPL